jgi:hypothetical protein
VREQKVVLEKQNYQLTSELEKVRQENVVLRDANIQFQVRMFELSVPSTSKPVEKPSVNITPKFATNSIQEPFRNVPIISKVECNLNEDVVFEDFDVIEDNGNSQVSFENNTQGNDEYEGSDSTQYDKKTYKNELEMYPRQNESQTDIQNRYKIKLGPMKLAQLNNIDIGYSSDGKFVNKILPWLFDHQTLMISTVMGGKKYKNEYGVMVTDNPPLDSRRLAFLRGELPCIIFRHCFIIVYISSSFHIPSQQGTAKRQFTSEASQKIPQAC